jgi:GT2 family glycosyltransferase
LAGDELLAGVVVVDNGGSAVVDAAPGKPVDLVRPSRNGGFGGGANVGIERALAAGATHVALLNDDVQVAPGWLAPLVAACSPPDVGAAQPVLLLADTDPAVVNSLGVVVGPDGAGTDAGRGGVPPAPTDPEFAIDVFTGGAVLFAAPYLRATGGFDERFFLYYEDVDLARRGARLGWRYVCVPGSRVTHRPGTSTDALGDHRRYLQERNRIWSALRNEDPRTIAGAMWLSIRRLRHPPRRLHARAALAGLGGIGRLRERR